MSGISSSVTVTGISQVEMDAWVEFLYQAFGNAGLGLGIVPEKQDGDTVEYSYCLDGNSQLFRDGVPEVMRYGRAFARYLAPVMRTTPDRYVGAILVPIYKDCQAYVDDQEKSAQTDNGKESNPNILPPYFPFLLKTVELYTGLPKQWRLAVAAARSSHMLLKLPCSATFAIVVMDYALSLILDNPEVRNFRFPDSAFPETSGSATLPDEMAETVRLLRQNRLEAFQSGKPVDTIIAIHLVQKAFDVLEWLFQRVEPKSAFEHGVVKDDPAYEL